LGCQLLNIFVGGIRGPIIFNPVRELIVGSVQDISKNAIGQEISPTYVMLRVDLIKAVPSSSQFALM
jgi:hypothetical protein